MAVGIPKKRALTSRVQQPLLRLHYSGKKTEQAILAAPAAVSFSSSRAGERKPNRLYHAENIDVLPALARDQNVVGKVRLIYIDPPFSTSSMFESRKQRHAYTDDLTGAAFIESLRERLVWLHRLLADDGSLYLHLDERMTTYMRVILDEIFGPQNFRSCITRRKCNPKNYTRKTYGSVADYILFYSKTDTYVWNRPVESWDEARANKEYQCVDERGRRYKKVPVHAPGTRNGATGKPWLGKLPPPGKHWQYTPTKLDEMDARGEIYWSPTGNPRRKIYLENSAGVPLQNIWMDVRDAHNQNIHIADYPTEKPPALLARIIEASSNAGDLVLDCYAGSGTTLAVASHLRRRWIGVDRSEEAVSVTLHRLSFGAKRMGDFVNESAGTQGVLGLHDPITDFALYRAVVDADNDTAVTSAASLHQASAEA